MRTQARNATTAIEVQIGSDFSRRVALGDALTRVGSHPSCELRISDAYAPPYLVTVERKEGEVWLHNRSGQVVQVGDEELSEDATRVLREGELARLNAWVSLQLVPTPGAGSTPAWRPRRGLQGAADRGQASPVAPAGAGPPRTSPARDAASFILSGVMIVAVAWLLLSPEGPADSWEARQVARLVQAAHGDQPNDRDGDPVKVEICLKIQDARIAELRGVPARAALGYGEVRDLLLTLRRPDGGFSDPWFDDAFAFVRRVLATP